MRAPCTPSTGGRAVGFSVRVLMAGTAPLQWRIFSTVATGHERPGLVGARQHDQARDGRPGTGFWPTTFKPKPSMPTMLFLLLVSRVISLTPRSIRIWAPTP